MGVHAADTFEGSVGLLDTPFDQNEVSTVASTANTSTPDSHGLTPNAVTPDALVGSDTQLNSSLDQNHTVGAWNAPSTFVPGSWGSMSSPNTNYASGLHPGSQDFIKSYPITNHAFGVPQILFVAYGQLGCGQGMLGYDPDMPDYAAAYPLNTSGTGNSDNVSGAGVAPLSTTNREDEPPIRTSNAIQSLATKPLDNGNNTEQPAASPTTASEELVDTNYVNAHPGETFHHRGQGQWARGMPVPGASNKVAVRAPKAKEMETGAASMLEGADQSNNSDQPATSINTTSETETLDALSATDDVANKLKAEAKELDDRTEAINKRAVAMTKAEQNQFRLGIYLGEKSAKLDKLEEKLLQREILFHQKARQISVLQAKKFEEEETQKPEELRKEWVEMKTQPYQAEVTADGFVNSFGAASFQGYPRKLSKAERGGVSRRKWANPDRKGGVAPDTALFPRNQRPLQQAVAMVIGVYHGCRQSSVH